MSLSDQATIESRAGVRQIETIIDCFGNTSLREPKNTTSYLLPLNPN